MIRVFITDDHEIYLEGLALLLGKQDGIEVIGTTPETREEQIGLLPNEQYYGGKPKLSKLIIRSFHDEKRLLDSFKAQQLTAVAGLTTLPQELQNKTNIHEFNIPLMGEVMIFLRNTNEILSDVKVRQALTRATDTAKIIATLDHPVLPANEPLLIGQVAYDKTLAQLAYNQKEAQRLLDEAGWKTGSDGIRAKNGKQLQLKLYVQNTSE